jgi:hypothetical protein
VRNIAGTVRNLADATGMPGWEPEDVIVLRRNPNAVVKERQRRAGLRWVEGVIRPLHRGGPLVSIEEPRYSPGCQPFQVGWKDLLQKLTMIDRSNIAKVAQDLVDESGKPKEDCDIASLESSQLWRLIGGLHGLEILETNSEVLIDLAFYVQQFCPEALVIVERLRLDGRELQWHVARLKGAARTGNLEISFPYYAQRAVVVYYRMTRRVLGLYEMSNFSMLSDLQTML